MREHGHGCLGQRFAKRMIREKVFERQKCVYAAHMNSAEACDRIDGNGLWNVLIKIIK